MSTRILMDVATEKYQLYHKIGGWNLFYYVLTYPWFPIGGVIKLEVFLSVDIACVYVYAYQGTLGLGKTNMPRNTKAKHC